MVQWLGAPAAFGVAGILQLLSLLGILAIPATAVTQTCTGRWRPGETWRGNGHLLRDRTIRHILISWWLAPTLLVGAEALVVAYMAERGGSAAPTGLLLAAFPAGAAAGNLIVGRLLPPHVRRRCVPWLFALVGVPLLPLALRPNLAVTALCFTLASAAMAYQLGGQQAFLAAVPQAQRGLAFGLFSTGMMGGQGVAPVLAGILADATSAGITMTTLGVAIVLAAIGYGPLPPEHGQRRADGSNPQPNDYAPVVRRSRLPSTSLTPSAPSSRQAGAPARSEQR